MTMPKYLYRYEKFDKYCISNLKRQKIWFSVPKSFNDPFEFAFKLKSISNKECELVYKKLYQEKWDKEPRKEEYLSNGKIKDLIKRDIDKTTEEIFQKEKLNLDENSGVCCFSEKNDDILMWSHYADSHKGFCLEFDTQYEPFNKAFKVNYSLEVPTIDPLVFLPDLNYPPEKMMAEYEKILATKYKCWEYEKEWRIFHEKTNQLYGYLPQSLTGIYFGSEMEPAHIEILALILQGQNPYTKFYRVSKDIEHFKVNIKEFNYIPYKDAKDKIREHAREIT